MPRHFSNAAEYMMDQLPHLPFPQLRMSLKY